MKETIGEKIRRLRRARGMSMKQLSVATNLSHTAISKWETGASKNLKLENLAKLAKVFNVSADELLSNVEYDPDAPPDDDDDDYIQGDYTVVDVSQSQSQTQGSRMIEPNASVSGKLDLWDESTPLHDDEVAVPFFKEVELSAGRGRCEVEENHGRRLRFAKSTLRNAGVQAEHAYCATVSGNSMEPVLPDGATVGIDTGSTLIRDGKLYAIDHDGQLRVKILFRLPGGGLKLRSFNREEHEDEPYTAQDMEKIRVLGRVFWWSVVDL